MVDQEFNKSMDNYLKRIKNKRTDPVDYGDGKAKISEYDYSIDDLKEDEIIIEPKERKGLKKLFISLFSSSPKEDGTEEIELEEEIEVTLPNKNEIYEEEIGESFENEEAGQSFFQKLFGWLSKKRIDELDIEDEIIEEELLKEGTELMNDVKETFKAINHWLNYLPPDKKAEFKNSEDFAKYKEFLRKYNLIKE
jgi:hypothetical protein